MGNVTARYRKEEDIEEMVGGFSKRKDPLERWKHASQHAHGKTVYVPMYGWKWNKML